jgi:hypothetical protein
MACIRRALISIRTGAIYSQGGIWDGSSMFDREGLGMGLSWIYAKEMAGDEWAIFWKAAKC